MTMQSFNNVQELPKRMGKKKKREHYEKEMRNNGFFEELLAAGHGDIVHT